MTPEQIAARWLDGIARLVFTNYGKPEKFVKEAEALAAIARHLAPDAVSDAGPGEPGCATSQPREALASSAPATDLVERATAALEGVTEGKPCQFHPSYCKEAEGTPFSEWDSSHDLSVILPDGKRYKIGHFRHSADAAFDQFARQWVPEAAARMSALTAERDALRDRLARMEGALRAPWLEDHLTPEQIAALTDGGSE